MPEMQDQEARPPRAEPAEENGELDFTSADDAASSHASSLSRGIPSTPLLNALPLARVIPQDVHSVMDYADALMVASGALMTDCVKAKTSSCLLGGSGIAVSAMTDYRLSLAKIIPIETHEVIDYGFGVAAISAPFVFGYYKTAPLVAALHVATGVGTIVASLFTDYRAYRGVGHRARLATT